MADYYYRTIGEAMQNLVQFIAESFFPGPVSSAGFAISYVKAGAVNTAGYLSLVSSLPSSPDNFYNLDGMYPNTPTISEVMTSPGFLTALDVSQETQPSGVVDFYTASHGIAAGRQNVCPAWLYSGGYLWGGSSLQLPSNPPCAYAYGLVNFSATDIFGCAWMDVNRMYGPQLPNSFPKQVSPSFGQTVLVQGVKSSVVNVGQPLDQDISINNGQVIYSVVGKATTILPLG